MENTFLWLLLSGLVTLSVTADGCTIDGLDWFVAASESILDTFRGNIWDRSTSNIDGIEDIEYTEGLNNGSYVTISHTDSRLIISTNDAFENYEEYETAMSMGVTITFRCTGGGTNRFVFEIRIIDTNNNDPQFRPSNTYEFIIAPPIPPGFLITNCMDDIIVRDIDLTTQGIDFEISGSLLFQITYDNTSTVPKEFKAALRTTSFIRSIPEPIILTVTATDIDRTGDPRRTATATVKVVADTEFNFPDEPIFSQSFYLATYTTENELILQDPIFLRQGFDEEVVFALEGHYSEYFELSPNANEVTFIIKAPIPVELYKEGQIFLVVKAERTYTSGATATVVVQLPEAIDLQFEAGLYEGSIEDNKLNLGGLKLKQGYEDTTITVDVTSDYKSYFEASANGNTITLSMNPLSGSIVKENNFINLQVTASTTSNSTATTVVTLEIIKDDITTPVFEKNLYAGSYDQETGLNLEQIVLIQGFDNTVTFTLEGEHSTLFDKKEDGPHITLSLSSIPSELFTERNILVSVRATKPRTVGANTVVQVSLPKARELRFEKFMYKGNFEENIITLETIVLNVGYESDVIFSLTGDHADYFNLNVTKNKISLGVKRQLPENVLENSFFVLFLSASGTNTVTASTTILLETIKQDTVTPVFSKYIYEGTYINSTYIDFETISLIQGYDDAVTFDLDGENAKYFSINSAENQVMLTLKSSIPEDLIFKEKVLLFSVRAEKPRTVGANAAISLSFPQDLTEPVNLRFSQNTYRGILKDGKLTVDNIVLESGFTTETEFLLSGDSVENFAISNSNNVISIELSDSVSLEDLKNNEYIVLEIEATRERAVPVISTLIVDIPADTPVIIPVFEKAFYTGTYTKDSGLEFTEVIALQLGFDETVTFELDGDNAQWFSVLQDGNSVCLISNVKNPLPEEVFLENQHLLFTIMAQKPDTIGGRAAISIALIKDSDIDASVSFDKVLYNGNFKGGVISHETIRLTGFTGSHINITGELATSFEANVANGYVTVDVAFSAVFPENLSYIALNLQAGSANAVLIIDVTPSDSDIDSSVSFDKVLYNGNLKGGVISHETIRLTGFTGSNIKITGELATSFEANVANGFVIVDVIFSAVFPENLSHIVLTLQADSANAVLILDVSPSDSEIDTSVSFDKVLYNGNLKAGVISHETIRLTGFTGSHINITGELATSFEANVANGFVIVDVIFSAVFPENLSHIVLTLQADSANAVLILDVTPSDSEIDTSVAFDKVLYNGNFKGGVITHETIILTGFTGSNIHITGELATLFEANVANGFVIVDVIFSAVFPENLTHIVLTLQADSANAVLILDVTPSDGDLPIVSFGLPSYFLWADINQIGSVGRVTATVNNGESVLYSITAVDDLQEHVSINAEGEILLSVSLDRGMYNFIVNATAKISQVSTSAQVVLRVDALPECSTEDGLPPLIILERVEEEPHLNLVVLNQTQNEDCWYTITSLWPENQSWLYVDNRGLHARAIDRENKSIAFMILSQIQVELVLHCDNDDEGAIVKRSLATDTGSELDPYTYGSSNWVLADTITYNARRSVVNLIVEDINDNSPIFVGKENEPIYVGYPIPELENTILPRALIELKATDADIGENAALMYWSTEENLAIAPTTGYVHVRNIALLTDNSRLTVYATDQNGKGLNGTLDIVVKLLERNQIAVITVRNAFLNDENSILSNLSKLVGYDVKILRTVVISDSNEETENNSRKKRETVNTSGASLQLYVYGMSESQLVNVDKLTSDLDNVVSANSVRVTSLEDHLEGLEICSVPGEFTALLAATITLAVVLFILIVAAAVWFLLKWRKKQNYKKFSATNSLASSIETEPSPKVESPSKPRLDIEELKRSERRLQEMLDAPLPEIAVHPPNKETNKMEDDESIGKAQETLINFTDDPQQPIIIQSIDKLKADTDEFGEDEFGEVTVTTPRKSVVTFNENVEKIIHLEYGIDETPSEPDTEVYRF
ncbi:protocadherin Fat 1-like isoform X3 [Maniola hyperantus]|uniref:protocadherin Fat 1-like isoform X3 n=1 Tax=Aphantopus hyperantus TaxID=2795564 RepID=UPI0037492EC3